MAFFRRNPNEAAYTEGKKHFTDVIKNTATGEFLLWKQPEEDFNTNSTLIVNPGEWAIFVKDGIIENVFENGKYKLSTENYPFISRLRNAFSGGISTFNCKIYFLRKADSKEILWGTASPIKVRDKMLGIETNIKGRGSYQVRIENPAIFLEKLIGNNIPYQTQQDLNEYFANAFQSKIRTVIAKALNESEMELLGIDSRLDEFSEAIGPYMNELLESYGLSCVRFTVSALDIADDELRREFDRDGIKNMAKVRNAQADKAVFDILGKDWERQQRVNILSNVSKNPGTGGVGAELGMGMASLGAFGNMTQQLFTPEQAAQPTGSNEDPIEILGKLKKMLDAGLIEQAEYDAKKAEVLSRM